VDDPARDWQRYRRGALPTRLPRVPLPSAALDGQVDDTLTGPLQSLIRQASAVGGIQVVVEDDTQAAVLRAETRARWPQGPTGLGAHVRSALAALEHEGGNLSRIDPPDILTLFLTNPGIRVVDRHGVLITPHSPQIPVGRQYVIAPDGSVLRSVRTTLEQGVHADDVMTAVHSRQEDGVTPQLASRRGLGPAAVPVAPGLAKVLQHIEQAMTVLMDKRNDTDGLWELKPALNTLKRYQDVRIRTELMSKLGTYFGTARLRSRFDALLGTGVSITVTVKGRWPWEGSRRYTIEVKGDLGERLDGGTAASDTDVALDIQAQGDMESATIVEQESAVMFSGGAEFEVEIVPTVSINFAEAYVELEGGWVKLRDVTTTHAAFNRLTAPRGVVDRPSFHVRYGIAITEYDGGGKQRGQWAHVLHEEVSPVVPRAFQALPGGGAEADAARLPLTDYLSGLDEFWELAPETAAALGANRYRFDRAGASGVTPHLANLDKLAAAALALLDEHDAGHGIHRSAAEKAEIGMRLGEVFDESFFGSHFGRLTGANGMPVALPWARRMLPKPSSVHDGLISNIKSALDVKLVLVPVATAGPGTVTLATTSARRHQIASTQQNSGRYGSVFASAVAGPSVRIGAFDESQETANGLMLQGEVRGEYVTFNEKQVATGSDDFTMLEELGDGTAVEYVTPVVQLTVHTRFSKHQPVSSTRSFTLGTGTAQLELPVALRDALRTPDPLAGWAPAPVGQDGARRPITGQLAYDTGYVHAFVPGDAVTGSGGVVDWVVGVLDQQKLLDKRFLSSTDVIHRKLVTAYDETALAGQLSTLTTLGVPVHLDIPLLGDKRLTVLLKGISARGPQYVRSTGSRRTTSGGRTQQQTGTLTEAESAIGAGPVLTGTGLIGSDGIYAQPGIAYRRDKGQVVGKEAVRIVEDLRRVSGPGTGDGLTDTTDDFVDELTLQLEVFTDWVPAEPLRLITSTVKEVTAPLAAAIAAKPVRPRTDAVRAPRSLNTADGYRLPIAVHAMPGTVKVTMTVDRSLTEPAEFPLRAPRTEPESGYRAFRSATRPQPGALNQALKPLVHGIGLGNVAGVERHVRYAAAYWNSPQSLWRRRLVYERDAHVPMKEGSYAPTGNKGRTVAQSLNPRLLRDTLPGVLGHTHQLVPGEGTSGISYGLEINGIARPLPRNLTSERRPMSGMAFTASESEATSTFARTAANQTWTAPLFGSGSFDVTAAPPHINDVTTIEPAISVSQHTETNYRFQDTYVAYEFTGRDQLHSRGVTFTLNAPGSMTGYLRRDDALRLAEDFPDQFVHPDAVTVTTGADLDAVVTAVGEAQGVTIRLVVEAGSPAPVDEFAEEAAAYGHTVQVATVTPGVNGAPTRLTLTHYAPPSAAPALPAVIEEQDETDSNAGEGPSGTTTTAPAALVELPAEPVAPQLPQVPPARLESDPAAVTRTGPAPTTAPAATAVVAPVPMVRHLPATVPFLGIPRPFTGRLEALVWAANGPVDGNGRAVGLLRYTMGALNTQEIPEAHVLHALASGRGGIGKPPRVLYTSSMTPDDSGGRMAEIVDALLYRAARLAAADDARHVLVATAGTQEESTLLRNLGLRPLDGSERLWQVATSSLYDLLHQRERPADLLVTNCESA
jgi:hypothetical protein